MPRQVVPGAPHHVTQRGHRKSPAFLRAEDYAAYLEIAARAFHEACVEVWAYCLMPNHVHIIATPNDVSGLARAVAKTHLRYARRINVREGWTGHFWQNRFASSVMDESHLMRCVWYVGLNPVRAGLTVRAQDWPWSSVRSHVSGTPDPLLTPRPVAERLGLEAATFFDQDLDQEDLSLIRRASATGRPLITNTDPGRVPVTRPEELSNGRR